MNAVLRLPLGETGEAVYRSDGATGRRLLAELGRILSLPEDSGVYPARRGCVIRDGFSRRFEDSGASIYDNRFIRARLNASGDVAELELNPDKFDDKPPSSLLRTAFLLGLLPFGLSGEIALFHGGLMAAGGRGILIGGPSGMGKSTFCRDASGFCEILADDMVLCRRSGERLIAQPMPTWSLWRSGGGRPFPASRSVEIVCTVLLGRGGLGWRRLEKMEASPALAASLAAFVTNGLIRTGAPELNRRLLSAQWPLAGFWLGHVPFYLLERRLEDDFSEALGEVLADAGTCA